MDKLTDKPKLADVALETRKDLYPPIDQVGMGNIEVPVLLASDQGSLFRVPARVNAKVSLDRASSRGIHMSRLYLSVQEMLSSKALNYALLEELSQEFLKTHKDLSRHAYLAVKFEAPLQRKALKSENKAWRTYPVTLSVENFEGRPKILAEVLVTYSSTCPASAALSRQLIQDHFKKEFLSQDELNFEDIHQWLGSSEGVIATPHAQRSEARVKVQLQSSSSAFSFEDLIDVVEDALQTPVQGAVKREDEQEFALRNGQNLMFCEDASRRIKAALDRVPDVADYLIEVKHLESLHPHNAEALITKGVNNGLRSY
ncbi:GTP cyclohydrolase FolE2 [Bdellovibrio sp. HCB337]|uniref:GTP cyclohydrolase FolE2 n=1 Tax=Bdellovibrio sp. HCB337 TaxID=3394358 RepID=UPI0039A70884